MFLPLLISALGSEGMDLFLFEFVLSDRILASLIRQSPESVGLASDRTRIGRDCWVR